MDSLNVESRFCFGSEHYKYTDSEIFVACGGYYLAQHLSTWGPATALSQAIDEPEQWEHGHSGGPGEGYVDAPHQKEANGEKPAGADLIRQHTADELTDGVGHGLAAGDHTCTDTRRVINEAIPSHFTAKPMTSEMWKYPKDKFFWHCWSPDISITPLWAWHPWLKGPVCRIYWHLRLYFFQQTEHSPLWYAASTWQALSPKSLLRVNYLNYNMDCQEICNHQVNILNCQILKFDKNTCKTDDFLNTLSWTLVRAN